jgi:site-specific DNA-methyltransferase (adenine-specific)
MNMENNINNETKKNIHSDINLMNGDCLELMNQIPDKSVDLICCDLPYGTTDRYGKQKGKNNRFMSWDNIIPLDKLWEQYKRILKDNGVVCLTADQPFTSQLVMSNLDWFKYELIWKKDITTGFLLANHRPMKQTEDVVIFSNGGASAASKKAGNSMTYNPQGLIPKKVVRKNGKQRLGKFLSNEEFLGKNNSLLGDSEYSQEYTNYPKEIIEFSMDKNSIHPTQKPVLLMEYLIKTYSNIGDVVLDNVMGSGSTGVACVRTKRKFIGIEIDEKYFTSAKKRIEDEVENKIDNAS